MYVCIYIYMYIYIYVCICIWGLSEQSVQYPKFKQLTVSWPFSWGSMPQTFPLASTLKKVLTVNEDNFPKG